MKLRSGITLIEEVEGSGAQIKKGDIVKIKLSGWLSRKQQIQKDHIVSIELGRRMLIPGIEYTLLGMREEGIRKVKISPHLGYGKKGLAGKIPPNASLIYEIEVQGIISKL